MARAGRADKDGDAENGGGGSGVPARSYEARVEPNRAAVIIDLSASLHFVRDPYKCGKRHGRERERERLRRLSTGGAMLYRLFLKRVAELSGRANRGCKVP